MLWSFVPEAFPGIPGSAGHTTKFAVEAVAFLELPAGPTTFGVSVGTDRTDVNDDDSYVVTVGVPPQDFFGTRVGEFERNVPPFVANTHNENQWTVVAPRAGVYPFRLVYWQGGLGANLQFYTVLDTGERVLVNDTLARVEQVDNDWIREYFHGPRGRAAEQAQHRRQEHS